MVWTTPMTAIANTKYTAAQFNLYVRDNLNYLKTELDGNPRALATTAGQYPVSTGAGALAMRSIGFSEDVTDRTTTSLTYTTVNAGPSVTITTGATALVLWRAQMSAGGVSPNLYTSIAISGATTLAASDTNALIRQSDTANYIVQMGTAHVFTGLTPGSNTFTMQHRCTGGTLILDNRAVTVLPF